MRDCRSALACFRFGGGLLTLAGVFTALAQAQPLADTNFMNPKTHPITRRAALRGLGAMIALPSFDIMGGRTATAEAGERASKRCQSRLESPTQATAPCIRALTVAGSQKHGVDCISRCLSSTRLDHARAEAWRKEIPSLAVARYPPEDECWRSEFSKKFHGRIMNGQGLTLGNLHR